MKQQYCSKQQPPTSLQGRYWTVTRRLSGTEHNKPGKSVPSFPDSIYIEFWSFLPTVPPVSPDWPGLQSADSPPVQCLYQWPVSDWNINWKCWQGTQNCWMVWSDTVLITFYCYQSNTTSNSPTSFFSCTELYCTLQLEIYHQPFNDILPLLSSTCAGHSSSSLSPWTPTWTSTRSSPGPWWGSSTPPSPHSKLSSLGHLNRQGTFVWFLGIDWLIKFPL